MCWNCVFIKITKTKTLAAYGQIVDVLFAGQKFPLTVDPTELPDGVVEDVSFMSHDRAGVVQRKANAAHKKIFPIRG